MHGELTPSDILDFWYSDRIARQWFASTPELDREIRASYEELWRMAVDGELNTWCETPQGCLALIIVLDQFPLNMFRGRASSFRSEGQAILCAKLAIERGFDQELESERLAFLYMPLMHSEDLADQELSVALFERAGLEQNLAFAKHHREIVRKFGRFPHRNAILGRSSSREELEYLNSADAFKG